jgi:hypothetical protein
MNTVLRITVISATLGLLLISAGHAATPNTKRTASNPYECWVEGEDGRKRPCSAGYRQLRSGKNNHDCISVDGHGRRLPCAAHNRR